MMEKLKKNAKRIILTALGIIGGLIALLYLYLLVTA